MEPYIALLILLGASCFLPYKYQRQASLAITIIMLLMVGLRDISVGTDTENYVSKFKENFLDSLYSDYLFNLVLWSTKSITKSWNIFLLTIAIITYLPLYFIIRKESYNPSLSLLIFVIAPSIYFFETFNILRQSISIVFLLYVYYFFQKERYVETLAFLIVAILFHMSSLIILPFLLMKFTRLSFIVVLSMLIGSLLIGLSGILTNLIDQFLVFDQLAAAAGWESLSKFSVYGNADKSSSVLNVVGSLAHVLPLTVVCLLTYPANKDHLYYKIFFAGVIVLNSLIFFKYAERLISGVTILQIFLVPRSYLFGSKLMRLIISLFIILLALFFIYQMYRASINRSSDMIPYRFYF